MSKGARNAAGCASASDRPSEEDDHTLSIRVVSRMFRISTLTLRLFEWRGLIRRKRAGKERVYSWADCERIVLLIKACHAGIAVGQLVRVVKAMDEHATNPITDAGRRECLALIHALEARQQRISNVLAELHRIDWELADRLGVKHTQQNGAAARRG